MSNDKRGEADKAWMEFFSTRVWDTGARPRSRVNAIISYRAALKAEIEKRYRPTKGRMFTRKEILDLIDTVVPEKHT